jgi:hypothetical protein
VPAPRVHLTRYHGVFAPNSKHRASVIMRPEERVVVDADSQQDSDSTTGKKRAAMTWAQCLKRAFKIDIELCEKCLGPAKVIACITDAVTINKILTHLQLKQGGLVVGLPASRAPPVSALSDS